jgi:hypothetical protein
MNDWYLNIEEPIRELVFKLRNNGINTECSCGHALYVQCQTLDPTWELHMIYATLCEMKIENYFVSITRYVRNGHHYDCLDIYLPDYKGLYCREIRDNENFTMNKIIKSVK